MKKYEGSRDPRFVAIHRGGTLTSETHSLLALWAADCAEHVLPLFEIQHPEDQRPRRAIQAARAWARGEITMGEAREAAYAAHAAATAHMADHELGPAAYGIKAVQAAHSGEGAIGAGEAEREWQRSQLPEEIRELVLSDQKLRNKKMWSLFE